MAHLQWQRLLNKINATGAAFSGATLKNPAQVIQIDCTTQQLCLVSSDSLVNCYPVSTSRYGTGQMEDSLQTPLGLHEISEKIGDGEPVGRVFKGRVAQPDILLPDDYDGTTDWITTRILRLKGLQPGKNQGQGIDSWQRMIYLHGTPDESQIGMPASIGCIRMTNLDVISLFDQVESGTLVWIE